MKLDPLRYPWMTAPETRTVMDALGGEGRFVGGAVRNALLKQPVSDIDIATPLVPEEVTRRLTAAGLGAVPTGIEHGTVTAIADGKPFEVTTLRRDVSTDGRRAVVAFTRQIIDDAGGQVGIDWHGHNDRDMGTVNGLAALEAGATRVHGTILGIGERVGNTPTDMLLVNLVLMGWVERDLTKLDELVHVVADATGERRP